MAARIFKLDATRRSLWTALVDASAAHGKDKLIIEDPERAPLTYGRLILGALVLGRKLAALTRPRERVGVFLPSVQGVAVTLFGLSAHDRVPAMLNFTAGVKNLRAACEIGGIGTIVTSRRFVDQGKLDDVVAAIGEGRKVIYLEDVRREVTTLDKLRGLLASLTPRSAPGARISPDAEAVVLFTSGTEGKPKGVVLSHANLVANALQIWVLGEGALNVDDVLMNPLPVFHSFGLTAGTLMPLLNGMKVVMYPSPLHYKQVPRLIGETKATVLLGTDTFLQGYARAADEHDLDTVRFVVAGAERVKDETRQMWAPYGAVICEGYGCTECAPVLACNTPGEGSRQGSVGRLLPGITHRLDPVEGIETGGRLVVSGPNVMLGYILSDRPGEIIPPEGGWHDTGDIVDVDADGFVTIKGRAKRFAKLGGEMVSLAAVETMISGLWPGYNHVVVALPDPKKGEQLVLITEKPDADRRALTKEAQAQGYPELWVPRAMLVTQAIPVLGSGKIDYGAAREIAANMRALL